MDKKLSAMRKTFSSLADLQESLKLFRELKEEGEVRLKGYEIEQMGAVIGTMANESIELSKVIGQFKKIAE